MSSQQIDGTSKATNQVVQEADEVALEEEDCDEYSFHAADERYEANEVLRIGMEVARNEEKLELDQAIQDDKKGLVIAKKVIEVPLEEKSPESEPLVYTSNQEVKDVVRNKTLPVLISHIPVGELQHQIEFWPTKKFEFLFMIGNDMV